MAIRVGSAGYCDFNYDAIQLRSKAQLVARVLPDLIEEYAADAVVVTGKSGHSVAFAAMMFADFPLVVVRKETDQSHGIQIEGPVGLHVHRYLILDDFVASGNTVNRVVNTMGADTECVGIVEYGRLPSSSERMAKTWIDSADKYVELIGISEG